jgi:FKBP-type peptidyl-prolyl cis-trans isomerase FklB
VEEISGDAAGFLHANEGKKGVVSLPSGLQYRVLRSGSGTAHPLASSPCDCHYEGRTWREHPAGAKFDSSYDRGAPATFAPNQVIKGWTEAMQMMVEGDKWQMFIPSDMAYGDHGRPPKIGGGDALVFTMELIKINSGTKPAVKTQQQAEAAAGQVGLGRISVSSTAARRANMARRRRAILHNRAIISIASATQGC